jgi:MFS family permease
MGAVSSPLHPACAAAVGHWVPRGSRSWTNGLVNGAALLGIAVTPLAFGSLIDRFNWPGAFLIASCVTAGLAAVWSISVPAEPGDDHNPDPAGAAPRETMGWRDLMTDRSLILLTLSYGAVGYFQYLFFYWMNYYFQNVLSIPGPTSRAYAAVPPLAMAVGMPLGGWLSDRLERATGSGRSRRIVPMAGMAAGAGLLALGVFASEPFWIVTWFALALGAVGTAEGPFWVTAVELGGRRRGSAAALFNTGGNAGGMLAPVVTPWVGQNLGWGYAVGLGALICLAGVALWLGVETGGGPNSPVPPEDPPRDAGRLASG